MYWEIGQLIIEDEQNGELRAKYGKSVLKNLANHLSMEFGKGFNYRNLNNMRAFFIAFPIWNAVRTELSWTHYRIVSRIENTEHKIQYIGRLLKLPEAENEEISNYIKYPYIFEFLGLPSDISQTETQIEAALITHLQQFLMELGKGFAFVSRQQHIVTDTSDFYIDLIFYNYFMKCFVLVDLKTHKLTHELIGQMDMYVRMYNDLKKGVDDNPTIGIILCTEKMKR